LERHRRSEAFFWAHQRTTIETVSAYLAADPHLPEKPAVREAALLKLPTGTRKSLQLFCH
jgi:hypothetical protein